MPRDEPGEQVEEWLRVSPLVQDIGGEDEIPRPALDERLPRPLKGRGGPLTSALLDDPRFAAALVANDLGDDGPDDQRRYDVVVTHDRELVIRAAEPLLRRLVPEH